MEQALESFFNIPNFCGIFDASIASYEELKIDIHLTNSIQPKDILLFFISIG